MSAVFDRYEREELPKLRPSSRERTMNVVQRARGWFVDTLHDPQAVGVEPHEITAFLEAKRREGVSARTVNLYRANLHRIFQLCVRPWLLIPSNPVAAVEPLRHEPRDPRVLTEDEYRRLLMAAQDNAMLRLFLVLAWETGARSGELLQLQGADVDFERRMLTFRNDPRHGRQTKGRRSRTVPLSQAAIDALGQHVNLTNGSRWIFAHRQYKRGARPGDRIESLYRSFVRAAKRAGLDGAHPHALRHAFVTRTLARGVPPQLVQAYVGHRHIATTLGYTHLVPEHLRAVVEEPAARVASGR
jgi:integrase